MASQHLVQVKKVIFFLDTLSDILVFELLASKVCVVFSFGSYVFFNGT